MACDSARSRNTGRVIATKCVMSEHAISHGPAHPGFAATSVIEGIPEFKSIRHSGPGFGCAKKGSFGRIEMEATATHRIQSGPSRSESDGLRDETGRLTMERKKLKLGKGSVFVKSRLRRFPQQNDVWEADFQPIANEAGDIEFWLGIVVQQDVGVDLAHLDLDVQPEVNDLARLLANAIQRPIIEGSRHRPSTLLLRSNAAWTELLPHLREIGIEVATVEAMPVWWLVAENCAIEYARMLRSIAAQSMTE